MGNVPPPSHKYRRLCAKSYISLETNKESDCICCTEPGSGNLQAAHSVTVPVGDEVGDGLSDGVGEGDGDGDGEGDM